MSDLTLIAMGLVVAGEIIWNIARRVRGVPSLYSSRPPTKRAAWWVVVAVAISVVLTVTAGILLFVLPVQWVWISLAVMLVSHCVRFAPVYWASSKSISPD
ncbi:MAG: hypothetical protein K8T25_05995 [Planctomycetia bacterium]|nr:hypothetical protein [Planctomycetia bacterium]